MKTTPLLGLRQPDDVDGFGQDDFNFNMGLLDGAAAPTLNARSAPFNAVGDGIADDTAALVAALAAAAGRELVIPAGIYAFTGRLEIPAYTRVRLAPGATLRCHVVGGGVAITMDNGAELAGAGKGSGPSTLIVGAAVGGFPAAAISALISNTAQDGTQEYVYIDGLQLIVQNGTLVTTAVIDLVSVFVNSGVRDTIILCNLVAPVGLRIAGGVATGLGPIYAEDVWITQATQDNLLITEHNPSAGSLNVTLDRVTLEHQASGGNGLHLVGFGGLENITLRDFHYENGVAAAATTNAILVDGCAGFAIDGAAILATPIANKKGVVFTASAHNARSWLRGIENPNLITPIVDDQANGVQYGAVNVPHYCSPDVGLYPVGVQDLVYGAVVATDVSKGSYCRLLVANGNPFAIAAPTNARVGQRITYEITNASGGAMSLPAWDAAFAYRDGSFAAPANGRRRVISFIDRGAGVWAQDGAASGDM